jgi:hypothetical protein
MVVAIIGYFCATFQKQIFGSKSVFYEVPVSIKMRSSQIGSGAE